MTRVVSKSKTTNLKSSSVSRIEPYAVLFCDDIRRESNGKEILIGVYSGDIVINQVPNIIALSLFIQVKVPDNKGKHKNKIKLIDPSGNKAGETVLNQEVTESSTEAKGRIMAVSMPTLPITIAQPGFVKVFWSYGDDNFIMIAEKRIVISQSPTALPPLS